jgi:enterochelin esterase-like enzyme
MMMEHRMVDRTKPTSPRLAKLHVALLAGTRAALSTFWQTIAQQGTPLIEPLPDDPAHILLTLLWRATEPVTTVAIIGYLADAIDGVAVGSNHMRCLLDTDVWYKTYRVRKDLRTMYQLAPNDPLIPDAAPQDWAARRANWRPDPFNPRTFSLAPPDHDPTRPMQVWSLIELPDAPPQAWIVPHPGLQSGAVVVEYFHSHILGNDRRLWVYTPPAFQTIGAPAGLLLVFDGWSYRHVVPTPTILDNLYAAKQIPPIVAILIDHPDEQTRTTELACSSAFTAFLADELVPWLQQKYNLSHQPDQVIVAGSSYGGLAASFAALSRPEVFGKVLAQSASLAWSPENDPEAEWIARQVALRPLLPIQWYLEVGLLEYAPDVPYTPLVANRHLRTVLEARGYRVQYREFTGGHEYVCWRSTFADGLIALTGRTS